MLWLAIGAHADDIGLEAATREALEANPELRASRLELDQARLGLSAAWGGFDPVLSAGVDLSGSSAPSIDPDQGVDVVRETGLAFSLAVAQALPLGGSWSVAWTEASTDTNAANVLLGYGSGVRVSVSQPLLQGGGPLAGLSEVRAARLQLDAGELAWRDAAEELVRSVSAAYWRLVSARERLRLAERSAETAQQQLADTQERLGEGFAGSGDVLQVERAVGAAQQGVVVARSDLESAQESLARLLGRPVRGAALVPSDRPEVPSVDLDPDAVREAAKARNTWWLAQQVTREQIRESLRQARNGALPSLSVTGSVGFTGASDAAIGAARDQVVATENQQWGVGADLSVPLPGRDRFASLRTARLSDEQAELALVAAEQDLEMLVSNAIRGVRTDLERVRLAELTVESARQALEADQELYREGRGSSRDVVRSLEELDVAEAGRLDAVIDLQASLLELLEVRGDLLTTSP